MRYHAISIGKRVNSAKDQNEVDLFFLIAVLAAHILLVYLMRLSPELSGLHALFVLLVGICFIVLDTEPDRLIYLLAYIAGSEMLWRMTKAVIFWEFGKYALILLSFLAICRWGRKIQIAPLAFGLCLLPAVIMTLNDYPLEVARQEISFNLSGPIALAITAWFFLNQRLNWQQVQRVLLCLIVPITGVAFLVLFKLFSVGNIEFTLHSNFVTSGGFGPNQVSAILGLGALCCYIYVINQNKFNTSDLVLAVVGLLLLLQAFLTFSRGGVASFLGAAIISAPFFLKGHGKKSIGYILGGILILLLFVLLMVTVNDWTGDHLSERFSETDTTGRWEMLQKDINIWQENFFLGTGPGGSKYARSQTAGLGGTVLRGHQIAAHTEYSRILAEHGLLGIIALLLLLFMFIQTFREQKTPVAKGLTLAFMVWACLDMTHMAMRLSAISFCFALPMTQLEIDE
jgi:hypothetical protein